MARGYHHPTEVCAMPSPFRTGAVALATAILLAVVPAAAAQDGPSRWYKGNTHTHTLNSDGDSTPDEVARWYREHGYQFLVLSDHNFLTSVDGLNALHGADEQFLILKGEEVTSTFEGKPLHVNGLDTSRRIGAQHGTSVVDVLQKNVDAIRRESGIPHINHPNFMWAITADELRQVDRYRLFEIFNGHPLVNQQGGGGVPSLEEVWDRLLSSGKLVYGIAVDDAHTFKQPGNPDVAGPGRGWVMVRAPRLEARAIVDALEAGEFYASTGVVLDEVRVTPSHVHVAVRPVPSSKYRIQFIGREGRLLHEALDPVATYDITGSEGYVRARVLESNGRIAWVQPVMVPESAAGVASPWALVAFAMVLLGALARWRTSGRGSLRLPAAPAAVPPRLSAG
jgi:hypothetical protein